MELTHEQIQKIAHKCEMSRHQLLEITKTKNAFWTGKHRGGIALSEKMSKRILDFAESKGVNINNEGFNLNW